MTQQLFRLGSTQWFVLVDTTKEQIIETYNKQQTAATIAAIQKQLEAYPQPAQIEQDLADVLTLIDNYPGATNERKARVTDLVNAMYQAYQTDAQFLENAKLRARLAQLIKLYGEM